MATLGPVSFAKLDLPAVAFVCALREVHPDKTVPHLITGEVDLVAEGLRFSNDMLRSKWASRGDSALLEYLQPTLIEELVPAASVVQRYGIASAGALKLSRLRCPTYGKRVGTTPIN